ncbi:B-cell receptor CD22-like isoform X1 [Labrus bergylta]|uniref:B-cell receptor CD22-like isoform X1 n=1 Tax=Labrus bergylta TaxID=56723 RepID=UPI003313AA4B
MRVIVELLVTMLTASMFSSVFFLRGALAACGFATALFITTPQQMEALSGSCLQIPCTFRPKTEFDSTGQIFGIWIKNYPFFLDRPGNVIFNSRGTIRIYPMNITGNLSEKQCTTLFSPIISTYDDTYFFRTEGAFTATALCDPLRIRVTDSPPSPRFKISGDLKEKESVTITCSASTPCPLSPPKLTWNLKQDSLNNMEENPDKTFTTKIQEQITLTDKHDGYNITCSATYPVNEGKEVKTAEETQTLRVSYSPKNTSASISPSGLVSAGIHVNLTCSSRANPPVSSFTWFKISRDGPMIVSEGEFYSFNATERGVYYCVSMNDLGNQTSPRIHLNIKGLTDGSQRGAVIGGIIGIILLICLVVGVILALVFWRRLKSNGSSQQSLCQTGEELAKRDTDEGIHYGEINFSKSNPEPSSNPGQDIGPQQETLYAQVKGSGFTRASDSPEDIYAEVKNN